MSSRRSGIVIMVAAFVAAQACGGGSGKKADSAARKASSSTTATTAESTTSTKPEPDQTPKMAQVNETLMVDGFEVTVHEVKIPVSTAGKVLQPVPGTLIIGLDTEVKNPLPEPKRFRPSLELLDAANRAYQETATSITPEPPDGDIPASGAKRGLFTFQVTDGTQAPGLRLVLFGEDHAAPVIIMPIVAGGTLPVAPEVAAASDPTKVYAKDEPARLGWAVVIVHSVQNPFPPPDKYHMPDAGMRFVVLDVDIFNTSKQNHDGYDLEAKITDAMNQTFRTATSTPVSFPARALEDIPAGTGRRGPITFQIPEASGTGALKMLLSSEREPPALFALA